MIAEAVHDGRDGTGIPAASRCGFDYTGCYCEENAWLLCQQLCNSGRASEDDLYVIFVSNPEQQVCSVCHLLCSRTLLHVHFIGEVFCARVGQGCELPHNCWVQVWLFAQRAGHSLHGAVCWDYHVFVLQQRSSGILVWDLDRSVLLQMATPCSKLLGRDLMAVVPTSDLGWPGAQAA